MNAIEQQLRDIAARLDEIAAQTPEMSGMDLAYDRGNVSREEWEAADAASKAGLEREQAEIARIDELRARQPAELDAYLDALLAQLAQQLAVAGHHSLLPDLIASLTAWRDRAPSKHSFAWAWRVVYGIAAT